uniref:UBC core domain-containing protein n=1 Tax=Ditylenchus dipsaci TaxID=166011 RepID=A0A915DIM1_9BILA
MKPVDKNSLHSFSALHSGDIVLETEFVELLQNSCLKDVILAHLLNDSLIEIANNVSSYEVIMNILIASSKIKNIGKADEKHQVSRQNLISTLFSQNNGVDTLISQVEQIEDLIDLLLKHADADQKKRIRNANILVSEETQQLKKFGQLCREFMALENRVTKSVSKEFMSSFFSPKPKLSCESDYCQAMQPLQFASIAFYHPHLASLRVSHKFSSRVRSPTSRLGKNTRHIAKEIISLSMPGQLPLTEQSGVFVRSSEERIDLAKVLIIGPAGTPYANGCFEFDVFFPEDYPNSPPLVNLQTTGNGTVVFNPNLYNTGHVCLSILNTWPSAQEMRWNAKTSSFLQVLISLQSLVLVEQPYYNEPGHEMVKNTFIGNKGSKNYSADVRVNNVRWAMLEQLQRPPLAFEDVIKKHFWLKKDEIEGQVNKWISETDTTKSNKLKV